MVLPVSSVKAQKFTATLPAIPDENSFAKLVENGQSEVLRGVYVKNLMALRVVQQPIGNDAFVSPVDGYLTEFSMASKQGNRGLLTHNYLAGEVFSELYPGQEIDLIYGDREIKTYVVTEIQQYRALTPDSPMSDFVSLNSGIKFTASSLFSKIYARETGNLVLQTCIYADQIPTWGRLFVIAKPIEKVYMH